jgi:SHS2 domain-containing protein
MAAGIPAEADFEEVEHTADWALRIRGRDLPASLPLTEERRLELEAYDAESLLVNWLSELAYWAEAEALVCYEFELAEVRPTHLQAVVRGGRAPELQKHIKAVTYHNLEIVETQQGLQVTVVFDV